MSDFRKLSDSMWASPQISTAQIAEARDAGVTLVINNRPDGEAPDEPQGPEIEAAAKAAAEHRVAVTLAQFSFKSPFSLQ